MEIRLVQKSVLEVFEGDQIISQTIVAPDLQLGKLHDANMLVKGWSVDRMRKVHEEEQEMSQKQQCESSDCCEEAKQEELPKGE